MASLMEQILSVTLRSMKHLSPSMTCQLKSFKMIVKGQLTVWTAGIQKIEQLRILRAKIIEFVTLQCAKMINQYNQMQFIDLMIPITTLLTSMDTLDMSIAFDETSSRSLSGVAIRNSGSQLFSLVEQSKHRNQH